MSEGQPRNDAGRFGEKVTEQDILKIFDKADAPFLTAREIADELPIGRESVHYRLSQMLEKETVGKKKTGARSVGWWAKVAPRLSPETRQRVEAADRDSSIPLDELEAEFAADG